jgi:hypothetical protein
VRAHPTREKVERTKIQQMENPMSTPDIIGAQNEILGDDVHANQKNVAVNSGPAYFTMPRRDSGGTGSGEYCSIARS